MEAVNRYGWKDVKAIAQHVGTRTPTQVRTHAQKLFLRQQKETSGMMAPSKNGRSDLADMPPMPISGAAGAGGDQLAALQEAGYALDEQGGGGGGSLDGGGDDGSEMGGGGSMSSSANPDAAPLDATEED